MESYEPDTPKSCYRRLREVSAVGFDWENFWSAFLKLVAHGSSKMDSKPRLLPKLASFPMLVIFCLPAAFDASVALFAFVFVSVRNCANCVVKGGK